MLTCIMPTRCVHNRTRRLDEKANKYHEQLKLVEQPNYKKIQVDRTEYIKNINAELIIMLAHGTKGNGDADLPASLRFGCPLSDAGRAHSGLKVFAKNTDRICQPDQTMLHDVIRRSKIVIMLAFYGNEVAEDYLKYLKYVNDTGDAYPMYPDILLCNGALDNASVHIFTVLLINLLDSQVDTLPVRDLHGDVRTAILRIMQIVQLFDKKTAFESMDTCVHIYLKILCRIPTGITYVDTALNRRKMKNEHRERHQHAPVPSHFVVWSQPASLERLLIQLKPTST